jgi:hypothetical protein
MRFSRLMASLVIAAVGPGCSLVCLGTSGVAGEARLSLIHKQLHSRARQLADQAWEELRSTDSAVAQSEDYERGFKDGFVRTVWWGPEEAPVVPPSGYWSARYQSPEGHQAIADWAEGFRRGVSVALQSGAAMSLKLPSSTSQTLPAGAPAAAHLAPVPAPSPTVPVPGKEIETLPLPRPAPAAPLPMVPLLDAGGAIKATAPADSSALKSRGQMETFSSSPMPARPRSATTATGTPTAGAPPANNAHQPMPNKGIETVPTPVPLFVTLGRPG